jgi:hypothetical protein
VGVGVSVSGVITGSSTDKRWLTDEVAVICVDGMFRATPSLIAKIMMYFANFDIVNR